MLTAQAVDIGDEEVAGELTQRLAGLGARSVHLPNYPTELGVPEVTAIPIEGQGKRFLGVLAMFWEVGG